MVSGGRTASRPSFSTSFHIFSRNSGPALRYQTGHVQTMGIPGEEEVTFRRKAIWSFSFSVRSFCASCFVGRLRREGPRLVSVTMMEGPVRNRSPRREEKSGGFNALCFITALGIFAAGIVNVRRSHSMFRLHASTAFCEESLAMTIQPRSRHSTGRTPLPQKGSQTIGAGSWELGAGIPFSIF